MRALLAFLLGAMLWSSAALAQVTIPNTFFGINETGYNTSIYPNFAATERVWNYSSPGSPTGHTGTVWKTLEPTLTSPATYNWTTLDAALTFFGTNIQINYTLGDVPTWANSAQNISGPTQLGYVNAFVSALMAHVAANNQCFAQLEGFNEMQPGTTWWTGTASDATALIQSDYPLVKASCPNTLVLSPSLGGLGGQYPYFWYQTLAGCTSKCFDAIAIHTYGGGISQGSTDNTIDYQPETVLDELNIVSAIQANLGINDQVYATEGWFGFSGAGASGYTYPWQGAYPQAIGALLLAAGGVQQFDYFSYDTGCSPQPCPDAYQASGPLGLSPIGLALRSVQSWLAGATAPAQFSRVTGTNLITATMNGAGVATGLIGGSGGCPGAPSGTGSLATGMSISGTTPFAAGMSAYVVSDDSSNGGEAQLRFCGTDSTSGTGTHSISVKFGIPLVTVGQNYEIGLCWANPAGSMANVNLTEFGDSEQTSSHVYNNGFMYLYTLFPVNASVAKQCHQFRFKPQQTGTAEVVAGFVLSYNYANGALPVDITVTLAAPFMDAGGSNNGMLWSGSLTKANGWQGQVNWCADFATTRCSAPVPAWATNKRDLFGNYTPVTGGATDYFDGPVLYENVAQKVMP